MTVQEKNGYKYEFVTNKNIKFHPDYKEFECKFNGKNIKAYLIGVKPNDYDTNDDLCLILPIETYEKMSSEEKKNPSGYPIKGKELKGYKDFIEEFLPPGL